MVSGRTTPLFTMTFTFASLSSGKDVTTWNTFFTGSIPLTIPVIYNLRRHLHSLDTGQLFHECTCIQNECLKGPITDTCIHKFWKITKLLFFYLKAHNILPFYFGQEGFYCNLNDDGLSIKANKFTGAKLKVRFDSLSEPLSIHNLLRVLCILGYPRQTKCYLCGLPEHHVEYILSVIGELSEL